MLFWVQLDRSLAGARHENGLLHPDAVEASLDRWEIRNPDNRDVSRKMLDAIAGGRNEAMNEKIKAE